MGEGPGTAITRVLGFAFVVLVAVSRQRLDGSNGTFESGKKFSLAIFLTLMVPYVLLRLALALRHRKAQATLVMQRLNNVHSFKDIMNNYLQAALLEPILAIYGQDTIRERQVVINLLMLASIAWWTWVISDAFDFSDVEQEFKYSKIWKEIERQRLEARVSRQYLQSQQGQQGEVDWLRTEHTEEDWQHIGSMFHDFCLWFMICCILAATCGLVRHSEVWHAYFVVILWLILHHLCWTATSWGHHYMVSLLLPSASLLPLQFCFLLREAEDYEDLVERRKFICDRCGLELHIVASMVTLAKPKQS